MKNSRWVNKKSLVISSSILLTLTVIGLIVFEPPRRRPTPITAPNETGEEYYEENEDTVSTEIMSESGLKRESEDSVPNNAQDVAQQKTSIRKNAQYQYDQEVQAQPQSEVNEAEHHSEATEPASCAYKILYGDKMPEIVVEDDYSVAYYREEMEGAQRRYESAQKQYSNSTSSQFQNRISTAQFAYDKAVHMYQDAYKTALDKYRNMYNECQ